MSHGTSTALKRSQPKSGLTQQARKAGSRATIMPITKERCYGPGLLPPAESSNQAEKGRDVSMLDQERKSLVPSRQELGQGWGPEALAISTVRTRPLGTAVWPHSEGAEE